MPNTVYNRVGVFQHTAARRRLGTLFCRSFYSKMFQHTAARRRLGVYGLTAFFMCCFNTQPPEGGWGNSQFFKEE